MRKFNEIKQYRDFSSQKGMILKKFIPSALAMITYSSAIFAANETTTAPEWSNVTKPIMDLINSLLTPALLLTGSIGAIYCVIVGVKFAKADEQQEREKAKAGLKNAGIGFGLIFVLIAALKLGMQPLIDWVQSFNSNT